MECRRLVGPPPLHQRSNFTGLTEASYNSRRSPVTVTPVPRCTPKNRRRRMECRRLVGSPPLHQRSNFTGLTEASYSSRRSPVTVTPAPRCTPKNRRRRMECRRLVGSPPLHQRSNFTGLTEASYNSRRSPATMTPVPRCTPKIRRRRMECRRLVGSPRPRRLRHSQTLTTRWRNPCVFAWRETSTANKKTGLRTHIRNPVLSLSPTTIDTMPYQRKRTPPLIEVLSFPKSAPRPRSIWEKTRM